MRRETLIAVIVGILVLIIACLFIFGFVQISLPTSSPSPTPSQAPSSSGLQVKDVTVGTGPAVKSGDTVSIIYTGKLENGTVFDSTEKEGGTPLETQIGTGKVIPGWDMGIPGMKVGGERILTIPPDLGYGAAGSGPIPPNETLIFDVKLVGIK